MHFTIDGVDMLPYLLENGFEWSRNDIEDPDSGRTMDGKMWRGRIATKIKINLSFRPLTTPDLNRVLTALQPEFFTVDYDDPLFGRRQVQMYSNNIKAGLRLVYNQTTSKWNSFSAPLVER